MKIISSSKRYVAIARRWLRKVAELPPHPTVIPYLRHLDFGTKPSTGLCEACGKVVAFAEQTVIPDDLALTWGLAADMRRTYDRRESLVCPQCSNNLRNRQLARAIVTQYGQGTCTNLVDLLSSSAFRSLSILEIDFTTLRPFLTLHPNFHFSDYITSSIPARGHTDEGLRFSDESMDLVVVADTLEHTPHYMRAFQEIERVLKPGGHLICTLPSMLTRTTVIRAVWKPDGSIRHLLEPSYHCRGADDSLVFVEFGRDVTKLIESLGFEVRIYFYSLPRDDCAYVYVCRKLRRPRT